MIESQKQRNKVKCIICNANCRRRLCQNSISAGWRPNNHIAQGNALWLRGILPNRPVRAKAFCFNAFALTGRLWFFSSYFPGRCPGLLAAALSGRATLLLTQPFFIPNRSLELEVVTYSCTLRWFRRIQYLHFWCSILLVLHTTKSLVRNSWVLSVLR